jgi:hypothetical protein
MSREAHVRFWEGLGVKFPRPTRYNCHHTFDAVFREDDHPWIEMAPAGTLAVLLLRRIAYTLLTLFRSRTQRSDEARAVPWRRLIRSLYLALVSATAEQLDGLRGRQGAAFR